MNHLEEIVLDLIIMLDSTLSVLTILEDKYTSRSSRSFLQTQAGEDSPDDPVLMLLQEKLREVMLLQTKVEVLRAKVASTTNLVSRME